MKKIISVILALAFCFPAFYASPSYADIGLSAKAFVLMCADNGDIILSRNENERLPVASLTKIMTAVVVIEDLDPGRVVIVDPKACGTEGSSVYLAAGEKLTVEELLYALLLESANDAAMALALEDSGSIEAFCAKMNAKALELGLLDTHYSNPHGLDADGHYSSARDLAVLTRYALSLPLFRTIAGTGNRRIPKNGEKDARYLVNHNKLLVTYPGCIGVKTGFTKRCGRCLVSAASRNDITLIAVTINDPCDWEDHKRMLDYGFSSLIRRDLVAEGETLDISVVSGVNSTAACSVEPTSCVMPTDAGDIECISELRRFYFAPVERGYPAGWLVFRYGGKEIARSRVYVRETVEAQKYKMTPFEKIRAFFR
ncbi:MAG: D-alanyl-D-alanine carboxypeptidase [Clostridia bacterium]|nr:D-alanyl-D-alanine carboxypeptidase [Clostridia bacterium]